MEQQKIVSTFEKVTRWLLLIVAYGELWLGFVAGFSGQFLDAFISFAAYKFFKWLAEKDFKADE